MPAMGSIGRGKTEHWTVGFPVSDCNVDVVEHGSQWTDLGKPSRMVFPRLGGLYLQYLPST